MATIIDETLEAGTLSFELARVAPRPGFEPGTSGVDVVPSAFATKVVNLDDVFVRLNRGSCGDKE